MLLAAGSAGMAETPEASSARATLAVGFGATEPAVAGKTCEVLLGGTVTAPTVGGLSLDSDVTGATSVGTLTAG